MKSYVPITAKCPNGDARSGVSLVEVLVSMMIMSIGVALLATLLPISILRTAQATQLTHAVFLKNNVEALIEANPSFLSNSQIATQSANQIIETIYGSSATTAFNPTFSNTIDGVTYAVIDPLGAFLVNPASPLQFSQPQVFWGVDANTGNLQLPRLSGGATNLVQASNLAQLPDSWSQVWEGTVNTYTPSTATTPPTLTMDSSVAVPTLQVMNSYSNNNVNVVNNFATISKYSSYRMVITGVGSNATFIKPLNQISGQNLSWWDVNSATGATLLYGSQLPSGFTPTRVRIEAQQRRFTWLMTVKKEVVNPSTTNTLDQSWTADVDVVVFFNRSFSPNDELPYASIFTQGGLGFDGASGVRGVDDDNNGIADWTNPPTNNISDPGEVGWRGSDDNRTLTVQWTPPNQPPPFLKKGGYVQELNNLVWYRILDFQVTVPTAPATLYTATLLLDKDVRFDPTVTPPNGVNQVTLACIFMKGIVDVYPLGTIYGQQ